MAQLIAVVFLALVLQIFVHAAPSDIDRLKDIAKVETADIKLDTPITLADEGKGSSTNNDETQGQRQKRFYNYYGYGFPPMNPVVYPNFDNRNNVQYPSGFGPDDPFSQIYKRLQDIAGVVRAPNFNQPPPPPPFPIFFPVIYIPYVGCGCTPPVPPNKEVQPNQNGTDPNVDISNRFPDMEDERQNWGFVAEPEQDDGEEEDFTRPISFEPIKPNRTMSRPPPAVEHGTNQAGGTLDSITTTTTTTSRPQANSPQDSVVSNAPTACDAAVLSCCHQSSVTYDCFAAQGCPDPTGYGNPCDTQVILRVINRFQSFYGRRTG